MKPLVNGGIPLWSVLRSREEFGRPELPMLTVTSEFGVAVRDMNAGGRTVSEDLTGYRVVEPGDLVVNKLWARFGAYGIADQQGLISPAYWVLRPDSLRVYPRYLHYLLRSEPYKGEIGRRSKNLPPNGFDLSWDQFRGIKIDLQPLDEQRRISDFLDDQVGRIDQAIELRNRQRASLSELWRGSLNETFLGRDCVPLKSVVTWQEGPGILTEEFRDSGIPVLRIGNVRHDPASLEGCNYVDEDVARSRWWHFLTEPGDLLVSGSASSGQIATWVNEEIANAIPYTGLIRLRVRNELLDPEYMRYFMLSPAFEKQIDKLKTGVGIQHWGPAHLQQVSMPVPSINGQALVVKNLREIEAFVNEADAALNSSVTKIEERKRSLITAAVTGQMDVTSAQPAMKPSLSTGLLAAASIPVNIAGVSL